MKALVLLLGLLLPGSTAVVSAEPITEEKINEIIKEIDELYRSESSHSVVEMEIVTPHWQRTLEMEVWTSGQEKTFIRILAPKKERGVATLRIGNEMWNYLPRTNKVIKVPPSMMMSAWMGSDFTNDDLVHEFSLFEDYEYQPAEVADPDSGMIYINSIPHEDLPIVWGNIVIAAERDSHLPLWQKYFDEKGNLMRVLEYSEIREFDGRRIPAQMAMVPQAKEGHRTVLRYKELEFNVGLDEEEIFSLRNLRAGL